MKPTNHKELYEYLVDPGARFQKAGVFLLSDTLSHAARTATTISATEFLGETRIALQHVLKTDGAFLLSESELAEVREILRGINRAFDERR